MKVISGGVTSPKGFKAANTAAGIKYTGRDDMAMIVSKSPCVAAGTFTRNVVKAAPVLFDKQVIEESKGIHTVVVNAGIANACTGEEGFFYCNETAKSAEAALGFEDNSTLVGSTGVIGMQLPIEKVKAGVKALSGKLSDTEEAGLDAAKAIMTTDTKPKQIAVEIPMSDGTSVTIGAMAKGSGMIHPDMCTMLCFITTDAAIKKQLLQQALSSIVCDTFNMISVDGDTSTNDTCVVLANGEAGNKEIAAEDDDYKAFADGLFYVAREIAMKMAGDGEGATALFEVKAIHCRDKAEAKTFAKSVITSNLTKAAIFGHDANWGRILCALGYSGADFDPEKVDITVESENGQIILVKDGIATDYSEDEATKVLSSEKVTCICDMKQGTAEATAWGCDLTYDYVKINADYRS
ncbi:MAG: bifunctional glutamate N-acetyltransferase/amino-acid acetyltransferase ArgJ [Lachnospiraceae bacterium]|nr:bifunctional glutamate N-acetyltransferase/amino-acid acetyltransferase ArgJ [Lachnospiraceae bacterium]MDD7665442.1 bifunctional glutamate N-acetyltransferase/amino-acid acetyltransferase ArgJ [Lachnospiraceae bacterium]MDY4164754.1 bifunctional glutamate N-acetyltransferase/amino-acid acetyltransferase ArgJ [Lachnospiraceae bacterium]